MKTFHEWLNEDSESARAASQNFVNQAKNTSIDNLPDVSDPYTPQKQNAVRLYLRAVHEDENTELEHRINSNNIQGLNDLIMQWNMNQQAWHKKDSRQKSNGERELHMGLGNVYGNLINQAQQAIARSRS